jgi:hypothetical protein
MIVIQKAMMIILVMLAAGCSLQGESLQKAHPEQQAGLDEQQVQADTGLGEKAKKAAETVKGVKESTAVAFNQEITAAVKVSGFDRLRLKSIKRESHDKIKVLNKDYNVFVTTDKKLFSQLKQIEGQINASGQQELTEILKRVRKINRDMQG